MSKDCRHIWVWYKPHHLCAGWTRVFCRLCGAESSVEITEKELV